jgi:urea transporter
MPGWHAAANRHPALAFLDTCLRGVGQIALLNNPVTGAFILLGLFLADLQLGMMVVVGLLSATLAAYLLWLDHGRIRAGLYGYNGALVGAAMATFLLPRWGGNIFIATVVVGAASTIMWEASAAVLRPFGMPQFTFPFNLVTIPFLWSTFAGTRIGRGEELAEHALAAPVNPVLRPFELGPGGFNADALLNALFRGISQLFLADSVLAGVLILIGFLFCSRIAALLALVGSAVGGLLGIALGANGYNVYHGIWGYNGFITAVALGFFLVPTWRSIAYAIAGAVAATILHGGLSVIFATWGVPSLTLPFCLTSLTFLLVQHGTRIIHPVPLSETTTPEEHRRRFGTQSA